MSEPNVQIDVNVRLVEHGSFVYDFSYGSPERGSAADLPPQAGQVLEVGSSAIARGLSIPLQS